MAADGRLLIAGGTQKWPEGGDIHGHALDFLGHRRCWLYNYPQHTWTEVTRPTRIRISSTKRIPVAGGTPVTPHSPTVRSPRSSGTRTSRASAPKHIAGAVRPGRQFVVNIPKVMEQARRAPERGPAVLIFSSRVHVTEWSAVFRNPNAGELFLGVLGELIFLPPTILFPGCFFDPKIAEPEGAYHDGTAGGLPPLLSMRTPTPFLLIGDAHRSPAGLGGSVTRVDGDSRASGFNSRPRS